MICVYKLKFESGEFYIGKTSNYKARIQQHLTSKGKGSPKLMKAFDTGVCLGSEVLEECSLENLGSREVYYITALKPTLNTLPGGKGMSGLNHPRSKYTKTQIEQAVELLKDKDNTYESICLATGISQDQVGYICRKETHQWATTGLDFSFRLSTPELTYVYSPEGLKVPITCSYTIFEKANNIKLGSLSRMQRGHIVTTDGWSSEPPQMYTITSPEQDMFTLTKFQAKNMFEDLDISHTSINRLLIKCKPVKGWKVAKI